MSTVRAELQGSEITRPFSTQFRLTDNPNQRILIDGRVILGSCKNSGSRFLIFVTADSGLSVLSQKRFEEKGRKEPHPSGQVKTLGVKVSRTFPLLWIGEDYLEVQFNGRAERSLQFTVRSPHIINIREIEHDGDFGVLLE